MRDTFVRTLVGLAKENKKFIYTALKSGARAREYEKALQWLEDAGMLKQAADNAHDAHVFGMVRNAWNQAGDTADQHGDLYAGAACFGNLLDDVFVRDGVGLHEGFGGFAFGGLGDFFIELSVTEKDEVEATVEKIKAAFDQVIPDNYTIDLGRYSKYRPSLHDYRSA